LQNIKIRFLNWYRRCKQEGTVDIRYFILWFMVAVYPLIVIPYRISIDYGMGVAQPNYFCGPRYVILTIVSLVALIILLKDRVAVNHPVFIPLMFFIIFSMISAFLAPMPFTAWIGNPYRFTGATTYYYCIILFILALNSKWPEKILNYLVFTAAIVSILGILQYFGIDLIPTWPLKVQPVSFSTMGHPNFLGTYMAFILPAPILLFLRTRKISWLVLSCLLFAGLVVSLCRGTWLAFLIGMAIIGFYSLKRAEQRKPFFLLLVLFGLITLCLLPFKDGTLLARILSIFGQVNSTLKLEAQAGTYRIFIWRGAYKLFLLFWPFGIGPDHLIYARLITPAHEIADKAHNIYLEMALTMGVFAFASYLAFLSFFLRGWKSDLRFTFFLMTLIYLIQGFVNIDVIMIMPLFWIILGLNLAENKKSNNQKNQYARSVECRGC